MKRNRIIFASLIALLSLAVGCESTEELMPPHIEATPLDLDPTEKYELVEWWSNGNELLRLNPNHSYLLYPGLNRYQKPIERGRWGKRSYAELRLEPYEKLHADAVRVGVTRLDDGRIALLYPTRKIFGPLEAPPAVDEDRVIGSWISERGRIDLRPNLRYSFVPVPVDPVQPVVIAGHEGTWRVENGAVLLDPNPQGIDVMELRLDEQSDEESILVGPNATYRQKAQRGTDRTS